MEGLDSVVCQEDDNDENAALVVVALIVALLLTVVGTTAATTGVATGMGKGRAARAGDDEEYPVPC
jgi:hypothetical protein